MKIPIPSKLSIAERFYIKFSRKLQEVIVMIYLRIQTLDQIVLGEL